MAWYSTDFTRSTWHVIDQVRDGKRTLRSHRGEDDAVRHLQRLMQEKVEDGCTLLQISADMLGVFRDGLPIGWIGSQQCDELVCPGCDAFEDASGERVDGDARWHHYIELAHSGRRLVFGGATQDAARRRTRERVVAHLTHCRKGESHLPPATYRRADEESIAVIRGGETLGTYGVEACRDPRCEHCSSLSVGAAA